MKRAGAAFAVLALVVGTPGHGSAAERPSRQVLLFLVDGLSYEQALRDPLLASVRSGGGIGLMTTFRARERGTAAYVSIGAGRTAAAGPEIVGIGEEIPHGAVPTVGLGLQVDVRTSAGARPGLLGSELARGGRSVGYLDLGGATVEPALLVAMDRSGRIPAAFRNEFPVLGPLAGRLLEPLAEPVLGADLVVSPGLESLRFALKETSADEVLVMVVVPSPSEELLAREDLVTPLLVARGSPRQVVRNEGPASGLTSSTTRREGIVSNLDVAPTILEYLGVPVPEEMVGAPIRLDGEPPTDLHRRYLEYQRTGPVVGLTVLLLAIASLVAALVVLGARRLRRFRGPVSVWVLGSVAALVGLQPASLLLTFELPVVAGTVLAITALVTWAGLWVGRGSRFTPVVVVAAIGLAFELLDAMLGWPTGLTPLLSGGALEGVRFYGLGNSYAGIVLGGAVLVAGRLSLGIGLLVIAGAAAFAGLPFIGADIGGGLTLLAAGAAWYGLRERGRAAVRWSIAAAAFLFAAGYLLLAHRWFPEGAPHVARATGEGFGGLLASVVGRLGSNLRATAEVPAVWLALAGLPAWLAAALRPPGPFRRPLERDQAWRHAVVTLALGGMIGYVVNDTFGMAAVVFVFVSAAMAFPALRWNAR